MHRPNILYLHCHDAGRYIQPFGHAVHTPHLQKLAGQGTLFRKAFCAAPTCSASRAALLTGQAPHSCGMLGLAHRPLNWRLHDYSHHLVHTLNAAGYTSVLCGVQHEVAGQPGDAPKTVLGYHEVLPMQPAEGDGTGHAPNDRARARSAAAWLRKTAPGAAPFFLSVGFVLPHRDFIPAEPRMFPAEDPRYVRVPPTVPDTPATRADMAEFHASVRVMDECCGTVLDALDEAGLADGTLVIATTDHGIAFPGMKCNLTDHGLGVYLIMRGPGGFSGGAVTDAMVSHIDLFPTVCETAGIARPPWLQGKSIMPLIRGETAEINDAVYGDVTYHAAYEPQRCIRTRRWKLIKRFHQAWQKPVLPNCDKGASKQVWIDHGWADMPVPPVQVYDLVFDPNETDNRAGDPRCAAVRTDLEERLAKWMAETDDPLLKGDVPLAEGCQTWPIDIASIQDAPGTGRTLFRAG
ncbi:sulfatase [bacterium]|nr:sulfatase [bacterium]